MKFNSLYLLLSGLVFSLTAMDSGQEPLDPLPLVTIPNDGWYAVSALCYTPNGKTLAVAGIVQRKEHQNIVKLWDTVGYSATELDNEAPSNGGLSISHDNKQLACDAMCNINAWDLETKKRVLTLEGHTAAIYTTDYNKNNSLLVSASQEGRALVWDMRTGDCVNVLDCKSKHLNQAFWNPQSENQIATNQSAKFAKLWDLKKGDFLQTQEMESDINCISYSPSGKALALAVNGNSAVCETQEGKQISKVPYWPNCPASAVSVLTYLPNDDQKVLAGFGSTSGELGVCDLKDANKTVHFPTLSGLSLLACTHNGSTVAVAEGMQSMQVKIFDLAAITKTLTHRMQEQTQREIMKGIDEAEFARQLERLNLSNGKPAQKGWGSWFSSYWNKQQ